MAELADALLSGCSERTLVQVQVLFRVRKKKDASINKSKQLEDRLLLSLLFSIFDFLNMQRICNEKKYEF